MRTAATLLGCLILSWSAGFICYTNLRAYEVRTAVQSVVNPATTDEKSASLNSYAQLVFRAAQTNSPQNIALLFCEKGSLIASAPRWIDISQLNCEASGFNFGKIALRFPLKHFGEDMQILVHLWVNWNDPNTLLFAMCFFCIFLCTLGISYYRHTEKIKISQIFENLDQYISSSFAVAVTDPPLNAWSKSARTLVEQRTTTLRESLELSRQVLAEEKANIELGKMAAQVAHDIRSPLAVLEFLSNEFGEFTEQKRLLVRKTLKRIREIVNDLVDFSHSKHAAAKSFDGSLFFSPLPISAIIKEVLAENEIVNGESALVQIRTVMDASTYGAFTQADPNGLKRSISNLVNNAIEASTNYGVVTIKARSEAGSLRIYVRDKGHGISRERIEKLGTRGATFAKSGGTGLGLFQAKEFVERSGGSLKMTSQVGKGTTVEISLPTSETPTWFVPELVIAKDSRVVIVDDDPLSHQIWQDRLHGRCELVPFSRPENFDFWAEANAESTKPTLFLIDAEIKKDLAHGFGLIARHRLAPRCILVTNHYDHPTILTHCREHSLRMLAKNSISELPIRFIAHARPLDAVLIDDDSSIRLMWEETASFFGKSVRTFANAEAFLAFAPEVERHVTIYVDSRLGHSEPGELLARKIKDLGFQKTFIATGMTKEYFQGMPWIDGVVDKMPPWSLK